MADTTAAIVWYVRLYVVLNPSSSLTSHRRGMPVRFMEFLLNLDPFRKALPTLHILRLCNRFGKGENAGITQLPKELIGFIEEELLVLHRRRERRLPLGWTKKYCCFEGMCRTRDHFQEVYPEVDQDSSEITGLYYGSDSDSEMEQSEEVWETCYENKDSWQSDVQKHMKDGGNNDLCMMPRESRV